MEPQFYDDKLIASYLLGELSEEEQTRMEERAFSDSDFLEQIRAVEKDLIDEYARGELSGTVRPSFERSFLASEHRRRQIEFAKAFKQVAGQSRATALTEAATPSRRDFWLALWRRPNPAAIGFSLAVVLLLVVIGAVLSIRQSNRRGQERAQSQPSSQPTAAVQENPQTKTTPEQLVQSGPQPAPSPENPPVAHQAPPSVVASLLLLPGTSRGAASRPQLVVSAATGTAQLRVVLQSGDEYKTYAVELRTTSGRLVRSQNGLQAHAVHGGRAVVVALPASLLATGDYELTLNGVNEQKHVEPLGYYNFSVRRE
jgi:anti-sigma-K factor RskA